MVFGCKSVPFDPEKDIPPLNGKVILVTGGNIGLGKQCVLEYARHRPALIWLAARNIDKAQTAVDEIRQQVPDTPPIKVLAMDLSSLDSVAQAARTVTTESDRLDILMLNAGVMAAPPGLTQDGYELQFGTNYLGHALLAKLLLPLLERTAAGSSPQDVRIVAISSHAHVYAPKEGVLFDSLRKPADDLGAFGRYGQSKLAMVLWTRYLARKYPQFTCASIHPGVVRTNLMNNATGSPLAIRLVGKVAKWVVAPVGQGVLNQLWASVSKDVQSGEYYEPVGIGGPVSPLGEDDALAQKIWDWTEKELERYVV